MPSESENPVREHLRAIRSTQEHHTQSLLEIKQRLGILEEQYASLSRRSDRIDDRLDRIERRLDLSEAPAE